LPSGHGQFSGMGLFADPSAFLQGSGGGGGVAGHQQPSLFALQFCSSVSFLLHSGGAPSLGGRLQAPSQPVHLDASAQADAPRVLFSPEAGCVGSVAGAGAGAGAGVGSGVGVGSGAGVGTPGMGGVVAFASCIRARSAKAPP